MPTKTRSLASGGGGLTGLQGISLSLAQRTGTATVALSVERRRTLTKAVRAELNRIERFLLKGGSNAIDLWSIMTALRGPDYANESIIKEHTTAPIRTKAFPNLSKRSGIGRPLIAVIFAPRGQKIDLFQKSECWHFNAHVSFAAKAFSRRRARKQRIVG